MSTRTVFSNTLVGQAAIQYIRAQTLTLYLSDARPNSKMFVYFDGDNVTEYCRTITYGTTGLPTGANAFGTLATNAQGQAVIAFNLPGNTFNTGTRQIIVTDAPDLPSLDFNGSVFGSAKTQFAAAGVLEIFQPKVTTITTKTIVIPPPPPPPRRMDPLAQSFFTYGVTGGIFLSSIDVFFQTKDNEVPVTCEVRPMVNGYPSSVYTNNPTLEVSVDPEFVTVSSDSSASTKFKFEPPIYLKEDSDYCFILRSNSKGYNVFTSKMGERSFETTQKIFEQPYVGSIFKSENDITWTAEQFDDIKFRINKAVFNISGETTIKFKTVVPPIAAFGEQFTTTENSTTVRYRHSHEHGLEVGSKLHIVTNSGTLYANAKFNGIPYTEFAGEKNVNAVIDRNTVEFSVTTQATSTGPIESANILTTLDLVSGGTNYTESATVEFDGLPTGVGATAAVATLEIVNGVVKKINLTNPGIGYNRAPKVSINRQGGPAGQGAVINASVQAAFSITANKPMTGMNPKIVVSNYGNTSTVNTVKTTLGNYDGGSLPTYGSGRTFEFTPMFPYANLNQNSLIASSYNESAVMGEGIVSNELSMILKSTNANLSPVINLNVRPTLHAYYSRINNQPGETLTATTSTGSLLAGTYVYSPTMVLGGGTIKITNRGSGYTETPIVTIGAPDYADGVQATATATLGTGDDATKVVSITVTNAGSGYVSAPLVTITKDPSDTATVVAAAAQASLTSYNTELRRTAGKAKARYLTKKTNLKVTSTGVRLIATISSVQGASVDWYIRTSMSGAGVHEEQSWRRLSCESERNKSSFVGEMFDYEFKLDNIPAFNTYDLKCVLLAQDPTKAPIVDGYRVIVVA
jgi:hypothetical protein